MKVQVIRSDRRQQIDVYDETGLHLAALPWNHHINARLGNSTHAWFLAEWSTVCQQPGDALEIGERLR